MDIQYRDYKDNDFLKQRELFGLSFPETLGSSTIERSHYDWKFRNFPSARPSYEYVAEDSELVGYYAAIPYEYKIENQIIKCGMVCDVMTHPERRGKGIFTKLGFYATEQLKQAQLGFTSGYPIRPEVIPGHIKVGWKIVVRMPMYLRPLSLKSFLPGPLKWLSIFTDPLLAIINWPSQMPLKNTHAEVLDFAQLAQLADYSEFLQSWLNEQTIGLVKSLEFLRWRTSAPETKYYFITLRHQNKLVGLAVCRQVVLKGIPSLAILDMMVLKSAYSQCRVLHAQILRLAKQLKVDVAVTMTSPQWAKKYKFFTNLFVPTPAVFSLIIKKLNDFKGSEKLFEANSWHLFWIDSDDL